MGSSITNIHTLVERAITQAMDGWALDHTVIWDCVLDIDGSIPCNGDPPCASAEEMECPNGHTHHYHNATVVEVEMVVVVEDHPHNYFFYSPVDHNMVDALVGVVNDIKSSIEFDVQARHLGDVNESMTAILNEDG